MLIYTKPNKAALSLSNVYKYMGWEWPLAVGRPPTPEEVLKELVGMESYLARKPWLWMVLAGRLMVCYASDDRKLALYSLDHESFLEWNEKFCQDRMVRNDDCGDRTMMMADGNGGAIG